MKKEGKVGKQRNLENLLTNTFTGAGSRRATINASEVFLYIRRRNYLYIYIGRRV